MIFSQRPRMPFLKSLGCNNQFVPLRCRHSLSAGRNLSLLAALRGLSLSSVPAGVICLTLHSTRLFNLFSKQTKRYPNYQKSLTSTSSDISLAQILMSQLILAVSSSAYFVTRDQTLLLLAYQFQAYTVLFSPFCQYQRTAFLKF